MNKKILILLFFSFILFVNTDTLFSLPGESYTLGNPLYSSQSFYIFQSSEMGISGTKDFLTETFLFSYKFPSKNRNAFSIRTYHLGFAPGLFTSNLDYFHVAIMGGFEYFLKIFNNVDGFFIFTDIGASNKGFAFNAGLGFGNRVKDGIEINCTFLQNSVIQSRLEFYFLILKVLIIRGKAGIDIKYTDNTIDMFTLLTGCYLGFSIKNYFRLELGGGFTVNDYNRFSGFGGISFATQFPQNN